jgi:hypothetical protein
MQIVIDISEERFRDIQRIAEVQLESNYFKTAEQVIANGTPLPKGHGRLIDGDKLELDTEWDDYYDGFTSYSEMQIKEAPTIIEADKESEE